MAVETFEPVHHTQEQEEDFFTPATAEEFEKFAHDDLTEHLEEVPEDEIKEARILWRGHDPHEIVGLMDGHLSDIKLDKQYVTLHWDKAISYNRGGEGVAYNLAMGFVPPFEWQSRPVVGDVPKDLQHSKTVMNYQSGNFEASGELKPENLRYVAIRAHGGPGKQPGPVKFYRYAA